MNTEALKERLDAFDCAARSYGWVSDELWRDARPGAKERYEAARDALLSLIREERSAREKAERERDDARAGRDALRQAGAPLANIAYNLAQHTEIAEPHRRSMREAYAEWDAVSLARIPAAIEPATQEPSP